MSPEFLLTSLIVVVAPGAGVLYTLGSGLARGGKASIAAAFVLLGARLALAER